MDITTAIADQIALDLTFANVGGSIDFNVARKRLPVVSLDANHGLPALTAKPLLFIVPLKREAERVARGMLERIHTISCGLFATVTAPEAADVDDLTTLVETLSEWYLRGHRLGAGRPENCLRLVDLTVPDPQSLRELRAFKAIWSLQFSSL